MSAKKRIRYTRMKHVVGIDIFGAREDQGVAIQFANTGDEGGKIITVELPWYMVKQLREKLAEQAEKVARNSEEFAKFVRERGGVCPKA